MSQTQTAGTASAVWSAPPRPRSPVSTQAGFTLVELAVVLFILAVAAAILLPRLPRLTGTERTTAVRRLALALEATHEEAAVKKKAWRSSTISLTTPMRRRSGATLSTLTRSGRGPSSSFPREFAFAPSGPRSTGFYLKERFARACAPKATPPTPTFT